MEPVGPQTLLSPWEPGIFSLGVYGLMVFALIAVFLFLCAWPGEKKASSEKTLPYECGIIPSGAREVTPDLDCAAWEEFWQGMGNAYPCATEENAAYDTCGW